MSQISNFFQNPIANLQALSLKAKTMIGLVAILVVYLFVVLLTPSPFQKPQGQVSNLTPNPVINSSQMVKSNNSPMTNFDKANSNIPLGYPQNIKKNKSNSNIPSNLMIGKRDPASITKDTPLRDYEDEFIYIYDRTTKEIKNYALRYEFEQKTIPNNKKLGSLKFVQDTTKKENFKKYFEGTNYLTPIDSIFFASPDDLVGIPEPYKQMRTSERDPNRGLNIYSTTDKAGSGSTYLKDYEKNNEFKLAYQSCKWITFSTTEFFCLSDTYQLVNLSTAEVVAQNVVDVTEDDDNNLYFVSLKGEVFKTNLTNPKDQQLIYTTKTGENITRLTYTNQKELLLHIVLDGGSEVFQAKKLEREKAQAASGYTGLKTTDKLATEMTIELLPNGSTKDRPEYKDYLVLL